MRRNPIQQLLIDNRAAPRHFEVKASADGDEATVYLYDVIVADDYWGGVSDKSFVQALAGVTASTIHLRVNSPGGDVFAARAMEAALRGHSAKVVAHVDGVAASAASFLIMAADEIEIADGAMMMIHKALSAVWGNADDMRGRAELLEKIDGTLVKTYADRTGQSPDDIAAWMTAETWFTADEAIDKGFADRKSAAASEPSAKAQAWNLRAYANAPAQQPVDQPAPAARTAPDPQPEPQPEPAPPRADLEALRRQLALAERI